VDNNRLAVKRTIEQLELITAADACVIPMKHGLWSLVDPEDMDRFSSFTWTPSCSKNSRTVYALRMTSRSLGKRSSIFMHREMLDFPDGLDVDHINGNGLDNRKCNLRACQHRENLWNQRSRQGFSSKYKGVRFHKRDRVWSAQISIGSPRGDGSKASVHLGTFQDEMLAAKAYDKAALEHFGEFAKLNF